MTTTVPSTKPDTERPGLIAATVRITTPFRTSTPRPSVRTVKGSANLISSGQTRALRSPISAAAPSAAPKLLTASPGRSALSNISDAAVITHTAITRRRMTLRPVNRLTRVPDMLYHPYTAGGAATAGGTTKYYYPVDTFASCTNHLPAKRLMHSWISRHHPGLFFTRVKTQDVRRQPTTVLEEVGVNICSSTTLRRRRHSET